MGCPVGVGRRPGTEDGGPAGSSGAEIWLTRQSGCDGGQDSCSLALDRTEDGSTHAASDPRHGGPSEVSPSSVSQARHGSRDCRACWCTRGPNSSKQA